MNKKLNDKVALITGATSGIGRSSAILLAQEGAKVVVSGRRTERGERVVEEIKDLGGEAIFVAADMASHADIKNLLDMTLATYGRLDYAFNSAAEHGGGVSAVADISEADFDRHVAVSLKGLWLCMKYEIEAMLKQGTANYSIINSSSVSGAGGGWPVIGVYSMVKSGVASLTKSAAQEYAHKNIRVNCLGGGFFDTEMIHDYFGRLADYQGITQAQLEGGVLQTIPLGRLATADEVAKTVLFLCSDDSSYTTGTSMIIDGGMAAKYI